MCLEMIWMRPVVKYGASVSLCRLYFANSYRLSLEFWGGGVVDRECKHITPREDIGNKKSELRPRRLIAMLRTLEEET